MVAKKRAKGKKGNKKRPARGSSEITITPAQRRRVIDTLKAIKKDVEDIELRIEGVQTTLCNVDFCSSFE